MVEQVTINPTEVRGYGNICEDHSLEDFIVSSSGLAKEKDEVGGALAEVFKLVYSLYGLMFDFDKGSKQLYLQVAEEDTLSFGFDDDGKQLYLLDEVGTGLSLGFDEDTNELYISDDAPPVVHNYSLALDSESYTTTGSLSVSATLLDDGVAVEGATVSFTGGVSTVTAVTDSSGVATATVTFSASGTLTATYSNVSDTASVTVQTYLFYDDCSSDNTSQYTTLLQVNNTSTNATLTFDSTEQAYSFIGSGGDYFVGRVIPNIRGADNISIRCKVKFKNTNAYNQFFIIMSDSLNPAQTGDWDVWRVWGSGTYNYVQKDSTKIDGSVSSSYVNQNYCYIELIKEGTSVTANLYDSSMNVLKTTSQTCLSYSNTYFAIGLNSRYNTSAYGKFIKEIKVESL